MKSTEPGLDREYRVYRIQNGTVIDHIPHWRAQHVIEFLGLGGGDSLVTVGFGLKSEHLGRKDLLKVENRELTQDEINRIALIAPHATINLIHDSRIMRKFKVRLPDEFTGMTRCANHGCITRHEPVPSRFKTLQRKPPVRLLCYYCQQVTEGEDIDFI